MPTEYIMHINNKFQYLYLLRTFFCRNIIIFHIFLKTKLIIYKIKPSGKGFTTMTSQGALPTSANFNHLC